MPFEQPKFETVQPQENINKGTESVKSGKEISWENQQKEIERSADSLGYKIDDHIKETVVAFNVVGLPTSASCEGHIDHGISAPWIEVSAPNQPEERFIGEREIFQRVASKYRISFEDVKRGVNHNAWAEALRESSQSDETPEYKRWRNETKKLMDKSSELIEKFYQGKDVASNIKLEISESGEGEFRVQNGGEDYKPVPEKLTDEQKGKLAQRLMQYQEEMKKFTAFLKDRYFSE